MNKFEQFTKNPDILDIGCLIDDFGENQCGDCYISEMNKLQKENSNVVGSGFFCDIVRYSQLANFAMFNIVETFSYTGHIFATSLNLANKLLNSPCSIKYFYIWDLEWIRRTFPYESYAQIYRNPKLKIIARSDSHKIILENNFNIKVFDVMNDWDRNKLVEICQKNK